MTAHKDNEHSSESTPEQSQLFAELLLSPDPHNLLSDISLIEQPAKVMRIGGMIKQLLAEVKDAPLDKPSRERLKEIYQNAITELSSGLASELRNELQRLTLPFHENTTPSDAELRVAQAQLIGWLEGLFSAINSIHAAALNQQLSKQLHNELQKNSYTAHKTLPPGTGDSTDPQTGQYL